MCPTTRWDTYGQWAGVLLGGLIFTAMGIDGLRLRKRSGMTNKEILTYSSGYMLGAKFFFVSGLIVSAVSAIGLIVKVLILLVRSLTS
ncbi:MAG: hypothetical protein WD602_08420 [Actinomycetota bacterium]